MLDAVTRARAIDLEMAVVMGEMNARGEKLTAGAVARRMRISRAGFYRKGDAATFKQHRQSFASDEVVEKDTRARRLYKSEVLQESPDDA